MNALQKHELEEMQEIDFEDKERFKINDKEQLNWALRKLAALEDEKNEIDELAAKEMERITSWREEEVAGIEHSKVFFESLIMEYAIKEREKNPKFKTAKTPYGKIAFKKQQPKWSYDNEKLVAFLNENELYDFVRVKEEPIKTEIKKQFTVHEDGRVFDMDGQEVEGITVEFQDEKLDIKVGE